MNKYEYKIKQNESVNLIRLSEFKKNPFNSTMETFYQPVNLEEGYIQIVYPHRKDYIASLSEEAYRNLDYGNLYVPFENNKVEFSSFIRTPHVLSIEGEFYVEVEEDKSFAFELITCGSVQIFVNEETKEFYAPMTRNVPSKKNITLDFKKGVNKVHIFAKELAERDVFFYFELKNIDYKELTCLVDMNEDAENHNLAVNALYSICLNKDEFNCDEDLVITYNNAILKEDVDVFIRPATSLINPVHTVASFEEKFTLKKDTNSLKIANMGSLPIGVYQLSFEIDSKDGAIARNILISNQTQTPTDLESYEDRVAYVYENLSKNSPNNITKALLLAARNELGSDFDLSFKDGIEFISSKGDCADFQTVPLLWLLYKYQNECGAEKFEIAKETLLDFRYWMDEPGNDAMWYFSENHAFLFHITQYLAGHIFKDDTFKVSGVKGDVQYKKGYDRLIHWFEVFEKYEFAEWNSTTYFPVDFIGFLALYECAPDIEIKKLAKKALDRTFEIIEMNLHHNIMGTTYGRVYEKELKGLLNGELALITWVVFGRGYYNLTNRASIMLLLSDYRYLPTNKYVVEGCEKHEIFYLQGFNKVNNYIYKTKHYQIGAAINYKYKLKGHQQHIFNISFSTDEIQLWLNNPGERVFSGESRPSFWAGNGVNPQVFVKNNVVIYNFDNRNSAIEYTHMYLPKFKFEKVIVDGNYVFAENKGAYLALVSTSKCFMNDESVVKNRELRFEDVTGSVAMVLSDCDEYSSLEEFISQLKKSEITLNNESSFFKYNEIEYLVTNNQFYVNQEFFDYEALL